MNKEFVTYEQALDLKELGFDERCYGHYANDINHTLFTNGNRPPGIPAPLYQQAFRWFREKHNLVAEIQTPDGKDGAWHPTIHKAYGFGNYYDNNGFNTYEEAEQACLDKLIEIVKEKQ